MRSCYLVGFIDKETKQVTNAGLFSEDAKHLTTFNNEFAFDVFEVQKPTFDEAINYVRKYIKDPHVSGWLNWIKPLIKPSDLEG